MFYAMIIKPMHANRAALEMFAARLRHIAEQAETVFRLRIVFVRRLIHPCVQKINWKTFRNTKPSRLQRTQSEDVMIPEETETDIKRSFATL